MQSAVVLVLVLVVIGYLLWLVSSVVLDLVVPSRRPDLHRCPVRFDRASGKFIGMSELRRFARKHPNHCAQTRARLARRGEPIPAGPPPKQIDEVFAGMEKALRELQDVPL